MDKYEYKIRADEIKDLIARGEYTQAAEIADTIDWRRVKSVMMLCTISDLYKINRRYEDAKNMLLLAYERRPGGRTICYSLCELCIKTEEFVQAVNYYKEYVQAAPKDSGRFILQYKLYEAQDVSLEERISVLEEFKKRDYREKWAYELAYLYHRVGLATRCVEECDELILWFGDGKYVVKAMELKMLHQPLSPAQQERYDRRFEPAQEPVYVEEQPVEDSQDYPGGQNYVSGTQSAAPSLDAGVMQADTIVYERIRRSPEGQPQQSRPEPPKPAGPPEELDIQVKIMDMGQYNTIDMQAEQAALVREVMGDEWNKSEEITRSIIAPMMDTETLDNPSIEDEDVNESDVDNGVETIESTEVFFGETGEITSLQPDKPEEESLKEAEADVSVLQNRKVPEEILPDIMDKGPVIAKKAKQESESSAEQEPGYMEVTEVTLPEEISAEGKGESHKDDTAETVMNQLRMESIVKAEEQVRTSQPPKELAGVLSQEPDGQIRLVVPERETVEKQITGQLSIQDILTEWERMKKEGEERRKEEVRQRVLQQTGDMFTEFDASVRDSLLEKLENGTVEGDSAQDQEVLEDAVFETEGEEIGGQKEGEIPDGEADILTEGEDINVGEIPQNIVEDVSSVIESGEETESFEEDDLGEVEELEDIQEEFPEETPDEKVMVSEDSKEDKNHAKEHIKEESVGKDAASEETEGSSSVERDTAKIRSLTQEEKELFGPYIHSKSAREQLVNAIDNISMASYTGNVIVTGDEGMDTSTLAKNLIREVQMTDSNFSGKVAKISGQALNDRDIAATLQQLENGALIIQKASGMNQETAAVLHAQLQGESLGIIVVMEDTKKAMNKLLQENEKLGSCFTARMEVQAMGNDALVAFGKQYAREMEHSIDELGILALHTRIDEMQTIDHAVTVADVKEIVDEAIHRANRKTVGHFVDILLGKRYDEEDMIILTEKDFV